MIAILQRVSRAAVRIDGETVGAVEKGFTVLLGVAQGDDEEDARLLADKISKLRVFTDAGGKMNLSLADVGGGVLVIPNFTLLANYRHGNRPDYFNSEKPEKAEPLFRYFTEQMAQRVPNTQKGVFGAHMEVELVNDGPITIPMDSKVLKGPKNGEGKTV